MTLAQHYSTVEAMQKASSVLLQGPFLWLEDGITPWDSDMLKCAMVNVFEQAIGICLIPFIYHQLAITMDGQFFQGEAAQCTEQR